MREAGPYLTALAYELGDLASIAEIDELKADPQGLDGFLSLGLKRFARSEMEPWELALESSFRTMEQWGRSGGEIDAIIYASNTFGNIRHHREHLRRLCCELDADNAYVYGVFGWECSNLYVAIQSASDLLATEKAKNVLVVSADKCLPGESRILPPNLSIVSDSACSLIVMKDVPQGSAFRILGADFWCNSRLWEFGHPSEISEFYQSVEGVKRTSARAVNEANVLLDDIRVLIANNYNASVMRTYAIQLGADVNRVFLRNLGRFAHAYAADPVINLADVAGEGLLEPGDHGLVLFCGPAAWGAMVVQMS